MTDYATLLRDHLTLNIRCIDRVFLQGYVPLLVAPSRIQSKNKVQHHYRAKNKTLMSLFDLKYPIFQAPTSKVAGPELAIAVSCLNASRGGGDNEG